MLQIRQAFKIFPRAFMLFLLSGANGRSMTNEYKLSGDDGSGDHYSVDVYGTSEPHYGEGYSSISSSLHSSSLPSGGGGHTAHGREKRSFDFGGLFDYAMGTIYALTTYPYPYPSLYGNSYGQRLNPFLQKFGQGFGNRYHRHRYSYSPGSYSTFHATRGYGFH